MNCPVCSSTLETVNVAGVEIDYCKNGCKGVWFDNYELRKLDEDHEGFGHTLEEILSDEAYDDSRTDPLICPRCNIKMKRREFKFGSGVFIDNCYGCNGVWLDAGELQYIRNNFNAIQAKSQNFIAQQGNKLTEIAQENALKVEQKSRFGKFMGAFRR